MDRSAATGGAPVTDTHMETQSVRTDRGPAGPCCSPAGRAAAAAPRRTPAR